MSDVMTKAEFAAHLGVSKPYVSKLASAGRLVLTEDGRVRVRESLQRIDATRDPSHESQAAPPRDVEADRVGSSYQAARAIKEKFLALTAKRDYEIACGHLMEAARVVDAVSDAAVTLRTRLEALPVTLGPLLAAESDESRCVSMLRDHVERCLRDLSERFGDIAKEKGQ